MSKKNKSNKNFRQSNPSLWDRVLLSGSIVDSIPVLILSLTLFLVAFFPDEKLNRLKLMCFGLGLIAAGIVWATYQVRQSEWKWSRSPLDPALLVYLSFAALYYGASANKAIAVSEFQRMIFSVGTFYVVLQVCSGLHQNQSRRILLTGWMGGLGLISLYGILQKFGGWSMIKVPQMERVFATFGNPIFFAAYLVCSIPILASLIASTHSLWVRRSGILFLIISLIALFFTGTRAAFLALTLSLILFFIMIELKCNWKLTRQAYRYKARILGSILLGIVLHLIVVQTESGYKKQVDKLLSAVHASRITATSQTHTVIWKDVLKMWQANPWLGTGYGTFHIEFPQYASEKLKSIFPQHSRIVNDAHNEYLQILAETGFIGFVCFLYLIVLFYISAFRNFHKVFKGSEDPDRSWVLYLGILTGVTALLIQNFFSVDMRFIVSSIYVFLGMGLLSSFISTEKTYTWGGENLSKYFKFVWCIFFLLVSGLIGIGLRPKGFYIAGVWRLGPISPERWGWDKTSGSGPGLIPALLRPYLSQKVLAKAPDFFDEKLLNAAKNLQDLEALVQQYPEQWKYWEKLGFALAKEIQKKTPDGRKVNNSAIADQSITAYLKAHKLNPKADGPPNNLGNIYYTINQRNRAIEWWKRAIELNPEKIDARLNLGLAYFFKGMIKESATQFEEVLKREPNNEKAIVMLKRMVE